MREKIIKLLDLHFSHETKWNEVYENQDYVLIYNRVTRECKVRYKIKNKTNENEKRKTVQ
jgi:hypothetical protein